jgi:hypothetical protein
MINANAESKFTSARTTRPVMLLLRRAPTGTARRPRMNNQKSRPDKKADVSESRACPNRNDPRLAMYG